jgi:hypothetical protein
MNPFGSVRVEGLDQTNVQLTAVQRALSNLYDRLGSSYISTSSNNVWTGTNTFKPPPLINAGNASSTTFMPMGALSKQTSVAGVGNLADLTDDTLFTYTLAASCLDANNQGIVIEAFGSFAANGNDKTVKLWFGTSLVFSSGVLTNNNVGWNARLMLNRTGASAQIGSGFGMAGSTPFPVPVPLVGTEATTGAIVLKVTGASPTTGAANDVVGHGMSVFFVN